MVGKAGIDGDLGEGELALEEDEDAFDDGFEPSRTLLLPLRPLRSKPLLLFFCLSFPKTGVPGERSLCTRGANLPLQMLILGQLPTIVQTPHLKPIALEP